MIETVSIVYRDLAKPTGVFDLNPAGVNACCVGGSENCRCFDCNLATKRIYGGRPVAMKTEDTWTSFGERRTDREK